MTYVTRENITDQVLEVFERTPDPRLREVMQSLVKHLHAFIREVEPSDEEFEMGCKFVVGLGQNTSETEDNSACCLRFACLPAQALLCSGTGTHIRRRWLHTSL